MTLSGCCNCCCWGTQVAGAVHAHVLIVLHTFSEVYKRWSAASEVLLCLMQLLASVLLLFMLLVAAAEVWCYGSVLTRFIRCARRQQA
jgi:hypothetical protein